VDYADALTTWELLNPAHLHATVGECRDLINKEIKGRKRRMFLLRIYSRLNRIRAQRERADILEAIGEV
jgi:hypothetical protein